MTKTTEKIFDEISETYIDSPVIIFDNRSEAINYYSKRGYFGPTLIHIIDNAKYAK